MREFSQLILLIILQVYNVKFQGEKGYLMSSLRKEDNRNSICHHVSKRTVLGLSYLNQRPIDL